jgi:NAD(P)-dependent dehydrogenase (short-subunit alcohol dehydrogenase family)
MSVPPARPFAVVTGASSGIGLEIAGELARRGHDLLVCAEDDLAVAADALRVHGTAVAELRADLATEAGVAALGDAALATGRPVDVLALNAGVALGGRFVGSDLEEQVRLIRLDVESVVRLAHRVLPGMVHRGHGRVLVTASTAATMPTPWNVDLRRREGVRPPLRARRAVRAARHRGDGHVPAARPGTDLDLRPVADGEDAPGPRPEVGPRARRADRNTGPWTWRTRTADR